MDKKQYNNIIDWTLNNDEKAQSEDSLTVARTVCTNLGVVLPQGDLPQVAEILATDDYMGWHACTKEEAQAAADSGIPAIAVGNDSVTVLAAVDDEQLMSPLSTNNINIENASDQAYYTYIRGTTNWSFNSDYLIDQTDGGVKYPQSEGDKAGESVFNDPEFYKNVCQKSSVGTIAKTGCAICCMAMSLLHKGKRNNSNNNIYQAVKAATIQGTNNNVDIPWSAFTITDDNGVTVNVSQRTTDVTMMKIDEALLRGELCMVGIKASHFVVIYGIDFDVNGVSRYLVADPGKINSANLRESIQKYDSDPQMSDLSDLRIIS